MREGRSWRWARWLAVDVRVADHGAKLPYSGNIGNSWELRHDNHTRNITKLNRKVQIEPAWKLDSSELQRIRFLELVGDEAGLRLLFLGSRCT